MTKVPRRWVLILLVFSVLIFLLSRWSLSQSEPSMLLPDTVDFNWHIRPILSDRCFTCHGPDENKRQVGLRFDTQEGAFAAVDTINGIPRYAIVPGQPGQSLLLQRINSSNPDSIMPPLDSHLSLNEFEKALLKKWIAQGATWKKHWAFIVPTRPEVPNVTKKGWDKNPIDAFVLKKLEEKHLTPSKPVNPAKLLRRMGVSLTGLPPTMKQVGEFSEQNSQLAYESLIDTFLNQPAYGERWAMYWLDIARYSDTHGYQDDLPRIMWPWRDWVIKAFNENMPYDRFVKWQLAGDMLPDKTKETMLASAFNRNHKISQEGGIIDEEYRVEYVADRTNTFGKAFLGLTLECARCHDHKYDPISQADYFSSYAFFNKLDETGFVPNLATPKPYMIIGPDDYENGLSFLNRKHKTSADKDTILQMVMHDSVGLRKTYKLIRGQYDLHGEVLSPTLPAAVLAFDSAGFEPNRIGMSDWLFDPKNPLTARVWVNRLWQEIFGRGLVFTSENFGVQGSLPSHPELLDWLAVEFMESGWDMKHMLRLMLSSATYQQSAVMDAASVNSDPENIWLGRGPRIRMPYEFIRDNILASSGLLQLELGGPSVKPWQPAGLWEEISTEKTANGFRGEFVYHPDTLPEKKYRRSLYTYQRRTIPPPTHLIFDAPTRDNCEVRRSRSNTPLQALVMLNDQQVLEAAAALSAFIWENKAWETPKAKIETAFLRILCRRPNSKELKLLSEFYSDERKRLEANSDAAIQRLSGFESSGNPVDQAALMLAITVIYNMDEAIVL